MVTGVCRGVQTQRLHSGRARRRQRDERTSSRSLAGTRPATAGSGKGWNGLFSTNNTGRNARRKSAKSETLHMCLPNESQLAWAESNPVIADISPYPGAAYK